MSTNQEDQMGLDTTHGCWSGAYSAYFRWRHELMAQTGRFTLTRERFQYVGPPDDWPQYRPLAYLMEHSDYDGRIPVGLQLELAGCLERQVASHPDRDWGGHIGTWHAKTLAFAAGLRLAHSLGEDVVYH
jgi:hypothetical protein